MAPLHNTLLVAFGLLTVITGLMTLLAGCLRNLTRTRRRSYGVGGLSLVLLGGAAAVGQVDNMLSLDRPAHDIWFAVLCALYGGAVLTAIAQIFIVGSARMAGPESVPADAPADAGRPGRTRPERSEADADPTPAADSSDPVPAKPPSTATPASAKPRSAATPAQGGRGQRQPSAVGLPAVTR